MWQWLASGSNLPASSENSLYKHCAKIRKILGNLRGWRKPSARGNPSSTAKRPAFGGPLSPAIANGLEQADDLTLSIDVDCVGGRHLRQARHRHDLTADRHHEFGTSGQANLTDGDREPRRRALGIRIGRERVLCLGDADR